MDEFLLKLEALKGIYWPSNLNEMADIAMLLIETIVGCLSLVRVRINRRLENVEPLFILLGTSFFLITLYWLRRVLKLDDFIPKHKRMGFLQRLRSLPLIRGLISKIVDRQMKPILKDIEKDLKADFEGSPFKVALPAKGQTEGEIISEVRSYLELSKVDWKAGSVSGCIYSRNDIICEKMLLQVYGMTMKSNHLHADIFSGIRKMEAEVIRWVINIFNGRPECCGSISSGGTESIVLACKAYRNYAFETYGITKPEIVVPVTAHAAFDKAADWLNLEIRKIPVDPISMMVDMKKMRKAINSNTIMLVGSAPGYPHGIVDPIEEISELGFQHDIPVHVDCCLGGFIMPFMKEAGFEEFQFDFRLRGVTSISADTHKYAMAPKGTSVVMYSDNKFHHHQFSAAQDWPGGIYITPTISGSRNGAAVAVCWAALQYHGREGYVQACREIVTEARKIRDEIKQIKALRLLGNPPASVVAFTSDKFNIYEVNHRMSLRGWHLNPLQFPSGVHICLTSVHVQNGITDNFLKDLNEVVNAISEEPTQVVSPQAAVYGVAQTIPDRSIVKDLLFNYMDIVYSTEDLKK